MIPESYENDDSISLILTALKYFLFEWRFADWPWNVVILLGFQVPVPYFDLIFAICDTCRCEITWTIISGSSLAFAFFREKHCVLFSVLRILPEWRWCFAAVTHAFRRVRKYDLPAVTMWLIVSSHCISLGAVSNVMWINNHSEIFLLS